MRRLMLALIVVSLASATVALPDEPAPEQPAAPPQRTVVRGEVPGDLPGRWLAVAWMKIPSGTRTVPVLWAITVDGSLALTSRAVVLPESTAQHLAAANASGQPWTPSREDLDAIAGQWDALRTEAAPVPTTIETDIIGRDGFDAALKEDPDTRDALWLVRQHATFPKRAAAIAEEVRVYATRERRDDGYTGGFVHAAIAMAPFALPITFHGDFQLYRVSDAPRSLLARFLDVFRGCKGR